MARKMTQEQVKQVLSVTMEEDQAALDAKLIDRLVPASKRILVTKPQIGGDRSASVRASGLHVPDIAMGSMAESGLMATVLACNNDVDPDIQPGMEVIVPEFCGHPIFLGQETPYWYIAEGDVQLMVLPEDNDAAA